MTTYTPDANKVVHTASVDFMNRYAISKPVHLVQYDKTLPIIAVSLYKNQEVYTVPSSADVNVRYRRPDGKFAYNPVLGSNAARTIVYVEMTLPMTSKAGEAEFIIEVVLSTNVVGSSTLKAVIDENPVQEDAIEATNEFKTIYELTASAAADAASASEDADSAAEDAASAAQSATEAAASAASVDIHTYGYYPDMETGRSDSSDQLLGSPILSADEPFLFKQTPDIKSNRQRIKKIKGGTIAWNQLAAIPASDVSASQYGVTFTDNRNGSYTVSASSVTNSSFILITYLTIPKNHKVLFLGSLAGTSGTTHRFCLVSSGTNTYFNSGDSIYNVIDDSTSFRLSVLAGDNITQETVKPCIFDLTLLFGSTIADRIYAMEQASAGSGVAWFKKLFPATYYPYNPGQLISVNLDSKVNRGFNQWDEQWESGAYNASTGEKTSASSWIRSTNYIKVVPNDNYYFKAPSSLRVCRYDANKNFLGVIPNGALNAVKNVGDCSFITISIQSTTYNNDICINLSWDGSRDGEYEPYEVNEYAFDPALELRGILSLDANDELVFDNGDEYLPGGKINTKWAEYTFTGTETWIQLTTGSSSWYITSITDAKFEPDVQIRAAGLTPQASNSGTAYTTNGDVWIQANYTYKRVYVCNSAATSSSDMQAFTVGKTILYPLATPTTEQSQPYASTEVVFPNGTEEMVALGTPLLPVPIEYEYLEDLKGKLKHLTNKDNSLPEYNVGFADQLNSSIKVSDSTPFNFRTAGGSVDIGNRAFHKAIVGGTIAWNQLVDETTRTLGGVTSSISGGEWSFTGNPSSTYFNFGGTVGVAGHKLLTLFKVTANPHNYTVLCGALNYVSSGIYGDDYSLQIMSGTGGFGCNGITSGGSTDGLKLKVGCFDLTLMFGSTIADYIYSLETATPGAGVAWFKKLFPKPYYAYNAGTLYSVKTSKAVNTGFNQIPVQPVYCGSGSDVVTGWVLDKTKATKVIAGMTYEFNHDGITGATSWRNCMVYWDLDGNRYTSNNDITFNGGALGYNSSSQYYVDSGNFTYKSEKITPKHDGWIRWGYLLGDTSASTPIKNACFHLSWDGSRDGEYEPYEVNEYAIDDVELRGIPKLDANNRLYYDGDEYAPDGTVTRKYGIVDLGTLDWSYSSNNAFFAFFFMSRKGNTPVVSSLYNWVGFKADSEMSTIENLSIADNMGQWLKVKNTSYTDAAAFKTAMSGVYLVYELATPTTDSADPYTSPMIVNDFGTESFNDADYDASNRDVEIPVGHDTEYPINMRKKLEMIPSLPTTAGTYRLSVTIVNGRPTYEWVAD